MKCPYCASTESKVIDKRDSNNSEVVRRRRECLGCQRRFTTYENIEDSFLTVIKKDSRKEPYSRLKLLSGIRKACEKRPIQDEAIERLADSTESEIFSGESPEVSTRLIGSIVMKKLRELDEVAYIRFTSVHNEFDDADSFADEVLKLKNIA